MGGKPLIIDISICYCTAGEAIYSTLKIPLPFLPDSALTGPQPKSILVADIRSATPNAKGVDMIVDADGSGAAQTKVYDMLNVDGPKEVGEVFTGTQIQVPEGVKRTVASGRQVFDTPGGRNIMSALAGLLSDGRYKLPNRVQRMGSGFEAIAEGFKVLKVRPASAHAHLLSTSA